MSSKRSSLIEHCSIIKVAVEWLRARLDGATTSGRDGKATWQARTLLSGEIIRKQSFCHPEILILCSGRHRSESRIFAPFVSASKRILLAQRLFLGMGSSDGRTWKLSDFGVAQEDVTEASEDIYGLLESRVKAEKGNRSYKQAPVVRVRLEEATQSSQALARVANTFKSSEALKKLIEPLEPKSDVKEIPPFGRMAFVGIPITEYTPVDVTGVAANIFAYIDLKEGVFHLVREGEKLEIDARLIMFFVIPKQ